MFEIKITYRSERKKVRNIAGSMLQFILAGENNPYKIMGIKKISREIKDSEVIEVWGIPNPPEDDDKFVEVFEGENVPDENYKWDGKEKEKDTDIILQLKPREVTLKTEASKDAIKNITKN